MLGLKAASSEPSTFRRAMRPRLPWLFEPPGERVFGGFLFVVAMALAAPIPFILLKIARRDDGEVDLGFEDFVYVIGPGVEGDMLHDLE